MMMMILGADPKTESKSCEIGSHFLELPLPAIVFVCFSRHFLLLFPALFALLFYILVQERQYRTPSYFPWWCRWAADWTACGGSVGSLGTGTPSSWPFAPPLVHWVHWLLVVRWSLPWMPWSSWWWRDWVLLSEVRNAVSQSIGHSFNTATLQKKKTQWHLKKVMCFLNG